VVEASRWTGARRIIFNITLFCKFMSQWIRGRTLSLLLFIFNVLSPLFVPIGLVIGIWIISVIIFFCVVSSLIRDTISDELCDELKQIRDLEHLHQRALLRVLNSMSGIVSLLELLVKGSVIEGEP
jgi:hypothetical protein